MYFSIISIIVFIYYISFVYFRAVQTPHPGLSYNPTLKDHQDLLSQVKEREEKIIKEEQHLERVTTSMFKRVPAVERDIADLREKRSGMDDGGSDDEGDGTNSEASEDQNAVTSINPPVIVKRKDARARRKQREQKEIKQELMLKKQEKKKVTDIHRYAISIFFKNVMIIYLPYLYINFIVDSSSSRKI